MKYNRLGIIAIVADHGEVDSATIYLIQETNKIVEKLYVIVNGEPKESVLKKLETVSSDIYVRENVGYDCGAYKYAFEEVIGWDNVRKYNELLLLNDSCYGPIYPWEVVFKEMETRDCDFWGITEQTPVRRKRYLEALYPYHIQSYFLLIRNRMLTSDSFRSFWEDIKLSNEYENVVDNFELVFTKYFNDLGYKCRAYIDSKAYVSSIDETQAYVFFDSYKLIAQHKCPLLKKKVFLMPHEIVLASNMGETARKTLEYVDKETEYNVDLIWEHLIRKADIEQLQTALHLDYICSKDVLEMENPQKDYRAALLLVGEKNFLSQIESYVESANEIFGVFNMSKTESQEQIDNFCDKIKEQYEYVCVVDGTERIEDDKVKESYYDLLLENAIGSLVYIKNVIHTFETNPRLGVLTTPLPYMAHFWGENIVHGLEGECTFKVSNSFWCRTKVLQSINTSDYQKIPLWAKEKGFYSGEISTEEYASVYTVNYQYMLNDLIRNYALEHGVEEFRSLFKINKAVVDFASNYSNLYVYGAGEYGYRCIQYLEENGIEVTGVIVSDARKYDEYFLGYPIFKNSEIDLAQDIGIIIAMNGVNSSTVINNFHDKNFEDIIVFSE